MKNSSMFLIHGLLLLVLLSMVGCGGGSFNAFGGSSKVKKRIFVTSTLYNGNLGGLTGADTICQSFASSSNLNGTFKAWLSSSTVDAVTRISDVSPWYTLNGNTVVFLSYPSATSFPLAAVTDESGNAVSGMTWTGTLSTGLKNANFCIDWTFNGSMGDYGTAGTVGSASWTTAGSTSGASTSFHLYCFEQ